MAQIVTITNPLTGQPAQVDQLEHTAQQIDDAIARALPGGDIDIALQNKASAYEHQPEIEIASDYFDIPIYVQKDDAGNVHINIWNAVTLKTIPQYGWTIMCNIPTGYRPSHTTIATSCVFTGTTLYASVIIMVDDGGNLQVYSGGDRGVAVPNNSRVSFSCSYGT